MDPSIMKLLDEDEDETMHSGADVEAFQAALNRDIRGDGGDYDASSSQPSDSSVLPHEFKQIIIQPLPNRQSTAQDEIASGPSQQQQEQQPSIMELNRNGSAAANQQVQLQGDSMLLQQKQPQNDAPQGQETSIKTTVVQVLERSHVLVSEPVKTQKSDTELQQLKVQKVVNQQTMGMEQPVNPKNPGKQIPFGVLLPALKAHLDKDREMQLQTLFDKLRKNEITKEQFVRLMRNIVGDQVLRMAVAQMQSQPGSNQSQLQSQAFAHQHNVRVPGSASASSGMPVDSSSPSGQNSPQKSREFECHLDAYSLQSQVPSSTTSILNQDREHISTIMPGHSKQQQQLHFPQTSFRSENNNTSCHPYSGANANTSGSSMKPQPHDLQMKQMSHQTVGATQIGGSTRAISMMNVSKLEKQNSTTDPNRAQSGSISQYMNKSSLQGPVPQQVHTNKGQNSASLSSKIYVKQEPVEKAPLQQQKSPLSNPQGLSATSVEQGNAVPGNLSNESLEKHPSKVGFSASTSIVSSNAVSPSAVTQLDSNVQIYQIGTRIPSASYVGLGSNARTPPKKPSVGQKKPFEALGSSPPISSKKQKVSGAFSDQSIEQLNDVTAVSGVDLREEEEQLFSGSKEDNQVSEASRRVVQEEEEKLILQKTPLQKKLAKIMFQCGLKNINHDVERCLSLCVEERMRGLISNLIRLSKQRVDYEKARHRTVISSDVRQQIMMMNWKAREEWDIKQAQAEKLRKVNEPELENGVEGEKEKDEGRVKSAKANKEEDEKMRTTAANVAARVAVGGDDMLSKWQLMAEQARQKREGGIEAASSTQSTKDVNSKPLLTSGRNMKDNQEPEKRNSTAATKGAVNRFGKNQIHVSQMRVAPPISLKDVIAALEREPQMSKSTLIYQLYERIRSDAPTA